MQGSLGLSLRPSRLLDGLCGGLSVGGGWRVDALPWPLRSRLGFLLPSLGWLSGRDSSWEVLRKGPGPRRGNTRPDSLHGAAKHSRLSRGSQNPRGLLSAYSSPSISKSNEH